MSATFGVLRFYLCLIFIHKFHLDELRYFNKIKTIFILQDYKDL